MSSKAGGIVMLEGHVRMSLQEGYHMREEDVFPLMHRVEIACNDNKLSPMMLWHIAPDHDGPSTSKSIPLQSTGFGVMLKCKSDHQPWWDKTTTCQWRALFASPVWSSDDRFVPIGDFVAIDVCLGPALQQDLPYNRSTSPQSSLSQPIEDILSTDGGIVRSWCNLGSCCSHAVPVPHVWCLDEPILCRCYTCTARTVSCPSCLPVALS